MGEFLEFLESKKTCTVFTGDKKGEIPGVFGGYKKGQHFRHFRPYKKGDISAVFAGLKKSTYPKILDPIKRGFIPSFVSL